MNSGGSAAAHETLSLRDLVLLIRIIANGFKSEQMAGFITFGYRHGLQGLLRVAAYRSRPESQRGNIRDHDPYLPRARKSLPDSLRYRIPYTPPACSPNNEEISYFHNATVA